VNITFVTKDLRPAEIAIQLAYAAHNRRIDVSALAEGKSVARWKENFEKETTDISSLTTDMSAFFNISKAVSSSNIFVIGLSSPIQSELYIARLILHARKDCKVVAICDNWGSHNRLKGFEPHLWLACDLLEAELIMKNRGGPIRMIGDIGLTNSLEYPEVRKFFNEMSDSWKVLLCSQKWEESSDVLDLALASLEMSMTAGKVGRNICLIPRWHPAAPQECKEIWTERVSQFAKEFQLDNYKKITDSLENCPTDVLAAHADMTIAATGSALRIAAQSGKIAVCATSPRLRAKLVGDVSDFLHPLAELGAALSLGEPINLIDTVVQRGDEIAGRARKLLLPCPFNPESAVDSLVALHHGLI